MKTQAKRVRSHLLYEGKCKKIFHIENRPDEVWVEFKDTLTAFNGKKKSSFEGKGQLNRNTSSLIFKYLDLRGILNHWICNEGESVFIARKIQMIPLEVVVRNRLAGSTARKFQKQDGEEIKKPLFELYYKDESLGDPFISEDQALMLGALSSLKEGLEIKNTALKVNEELISLFSSAGMNLIDFKLEFGKTQKGELLLGDEISADSCRIWKKENAERLDKDRFRLDLDHVKKGYQTIYQNLQQKAYSFSCM